jgi:predicted S18 family serine protease
MFISEIYLNEQNKIKKVEDEIKEKEEKLKEKIDKIHWLEHALEEAKESLEKKALKGAIQRLKAIIAGEASLLAEERKKFVQLKYAKNIASEIRV